MGIGDQFGLYDVAAHVIPGVMVLAAAATVAAPLAAPLPVPQDGVVVAAVGFAVAYVAGTLCQLLAEWPPLRLAIKRWRWERESHESSLLRKEGEPWAGVRAALLRHAGLDVPVAAPGEPTLGDWWRRWRAWGKDASARPGPQADVDAREAAFRACYATVLQEGNPSRAQMFKAISAFHESMAMASLLVAIAGALVALASPPAWPLGLGMVAGGLLGFRAFSRAYAAFDARFVKEVYAAFLALARRFDREAAAGEGRGRPRRVRVTAVDDARSAPAGAAPSGDAS